MTFAKFTLKFLVASQGICRSWRHLVPLSDILLQLACRALLELYLDLIQQKLFLDSRKWTVANLQPLDRQKIR